MSKKRVVIYLTNDEYGLIKKMSMLHGLPISTYIKLAGLRRYIGESASGSGVYKKEMKSILNQIKDFHINNIKKEKQITVYLNGEEFNFIATISKKQGLSKSNYLKIVGTRRFIGIHKEAKIISKEMKKAVRGLSKEGGNFTSALKLNNKK